MLIKLCVVSAVLYSLIQLGSVTHLVERHFHQCTAETDRASGVHQLENQAH